MVVALIGRKGVKRMLENIATKPIFQKDRPYVDASAAKKSRSFVCTANQLIELGLPMPMYVVRFNGNTGEVEYKPFQGTKSGFVLPSVNQTSDAEW